MFGNFQATFPDYGAGKGLCCRLIGSCVEVPDYGAGNIPVLKLLIARGRAPCLGPWGRGESARRRAVHGASGLGVWHFCKLQNVPYLK